MSYLYTQINRLEEPHSYMYTPFQGEVLLWEYQAGRLEILHRYVGGFDAIDATDTGYDARVVPLLEKGLAAISPEAGRRFQALVPEAHAPQGHGLDDQSDRLLQLKIDQSIETLDLMHAVLATQMAGLNDGLVKEWLDRLVQRFEVTKKIYEAYPPGFRKGEGAGKSVHLYWLFALALSLYYANTRQLKYLSTLLKVCDLLCSLPENLRSGHLPPRVMAAVLATEVISVQLLVAVKEIQIAPE